MAVSKRTSLRDRLVGTAFASTGWAVVVMAIAVAIVSLHLERQQNFLAAVRLTDTIAQRSNEAIRRLTSETQILSHMPPIQVIIRAQDNGGIDPVSGDRTEVGTERLAAIFAAFHRMQPEIAQIRFIGLKSRGLEIVRVDKVNGRIARIRDDALQTKDHRDYFARGLELAPGETVLTPVSYNRENGMIREPRTAMFRVVHPIFRDTGERFGMIVMNVDVEMHSKAVYAPLNLEADVVISRASGSNYHWRAASQSGQFSENGLSHLPSDVREAIASATDRPAETRAGGFVIATRRLPALRNSDADVNFAVLAPMGILGAGTPFLTYSLIGIGLTILAAGTTLAGRLMDRELSPLTDISNQIRRYSPGASLPSLPVDRDDEIGELSRAFTALAENLVAQAIHVQTVLDGAGDCIVTVDPGGRILQANRAVETLFGHDPDSLVGQDLGILMPPDMRQRHTAFLAGAEPDFKARSMARSRSVQAQRADGSTFDVEVTISKVQGPAGPILVGIMRDQTERREQERIRNELVASLGNAVEELKRSNEELDNFAYVASHDLKAPLRVIDNASRWLEEDLAGKLDDDTRESLDMLRSRVKRMEKLLDDLLAHSRIGRETQPSDEIGGVELIDNVRLLAGVPESFTCEIDAGFNEVTVQRMPLQTVLVNLVSNAVKHHDRSDGHIRLSVSHPGDMLEIEVADDGPGIAERYHGKIFRMFQTLKSRDRVEGSGMGLAMVKKIMDIHGGAIRLVSDEGHGCRFIVHWPCAAGPAERNVA
ncbi:MAG: sensor histidine kinase [Roseovarius sp.]